MKQTIGIGLLLIITAYGVSPLLTIGWFEWNQAALVEAHCVNKDRPELMCGGHCYLSKQLAKTMPTTPAREETSPEIRVPMFPVYLPAQEQLPLPDPAAAAHRAEGTLAHYCPHIPALLRPPQFR